MLTIVLKWLECPFEVINDCDSLESLNKQEKKRLDALMNGQTLLIKNLHCLGYLYIGRFFISV